jgi:uncharacterized protein YcbX
MPEDAVRLVDPDYASHGEVVSFADGFPYLVVSQGSLEQLSERVGEPMSAGRFRPNLVIGGCEPGAEDGWKRVRIGGAVFSLLKPCSRCEIVTINPDSGHAGKEPLATLAGYRKQGKKVLFGQNAVAQGRGRVRRGDAVQVLE